MTGYKAEKVVLLYAAFFFFGLNVTGFGADPEIHVTWDESPAPVQGFDYFVTTSSPASAAFPNIELVEGSLTWRIWSTDTDNPNGIGDIGVISSPHAQNFSVTVKDLSGGVGARHVKAINLDPTNSSNYSNVEATISGNIEDNVFVQANNSGSGGEAYLWVSGTNITADMTLPKVNVLTGAGTFSGTIAIGEAVYGGGVQLGILSGDLTIDLCNEEASIQVIYLSGNITISQFKEGSSFSLYNDMTAGTATFGGIEGSVSHGVLIMLGNSLCNPPCDDIAGTVTFLEGVPAGMNVDADGQITSSGEIYLSGKEIAGTMTLHAGGAGNIVAGGMVTGSVTLGEVATPDFEFSGNADFAGVGLAGSVEIIGDGVIDFEEVVDGNLCGTGIAYNSPLPNNILIGCGLGPNARLCSTAPSCPSGTISAANPPDGTQDARRPYPKSSGSTPVTLASRQGIGSPNPSATADDIITITLSDSDLRAISHNCWTLCETGIEAVDTGTTALLANEITCITETVVGGDTYEIRLARPISAGHWTTIEYAGGGMVSYASLPADSSANEHSAPADILAHIDCCLNETCSPPFGVYSCDINHSGGAFDEDDLYTLIDLLNGAGNFIVWYGKTLPENECAEESFMGGGGGGGDSFTSADFSDWLVNYISTTHPADSLAGDRFAAIVASLTQWCLDHFASQDLADLAVNLSDPGLTFASSAGEDAAAGVVAAIAP